MARKSHIRGTRRDRRKARQSDFAREGTSNPRKKGHHAYERVETTPAAPPSKQATVVCRENPRLHDFTLFPDMGIKVCRSCGQRRKMAETEFRRSGNPLPIPESIRRKAVQHGNKQAESPPAGDVSPGLQNLVPNQVACRGDHDLVADPELGIRICRNCDFFTK